MPQQMASSWYRTLADDEEYRKRSPLEAGANKSLIQQARLFTRGKEWGTGLWEVECDSRQRSHHTVLASIAESRGRLWVQGQEEDLSIPGSWPMCWASVN